MNVNAGLACAFQIEVKNSNDEVVQETGWMKNMITDAGLEYIADLDKRQDWNQGIIAVGNDDTAPTASDTSLGNILSFNSTGFNVNNYEGDNGSNISYFICEYKSIIQNVNAEIKELGFYKSNSSSNLNESILISHALIVDSNNNPTTINVSEPDMITVRYRIYILSDIDTPDTIKNTTIDNTNYTVTERTHDLEYSNYADDIIFGNEFSIRYMSNSQLQNKWSEVSPGNNVKQENVRYNETNQTPNASTGFVSYWYKEGTSLYLVWQESLDSNLEDIGSIMIGYQGSGSSTRNCLPFSIGFSPKLPIGGKDMFVKIKINFYRKDAPTEVIEYQS